MRITEVEPILLRGAEAYASPDSGAEATDNGDWQLLLRIAFWQIHHLQQGLSAGAVVL